MAEIYHLTVPQACLTFAGDEAGDASFAFDKGASSHFVLALIATTQAESLRQALADVRCRRGLQSDYEFKYHKLSSAALRQAAFEALQAMDFIVLRLRATIKPQIANSLLEERSSNMSTDKFAFIRADMDALRESSLLITIRTTGSPADAWMIANGRRVLARQTRGEAPVTS